MSPNLVIPEEKIPKIGKVSYFLPYCSLNSRPGVCFLFSLTSSLPISDNNCSSHPTVQKAVTC